jgi:hypothetical protein
VAALYAKIARIRLAAGRERSASVSNAANNNNNAPAPSSSATTRTVRGQSVVQPKPPQVENTSSLTTSTTTA